MSIRNWITLIESHNLILYHGTCDESAASLIANGWQPNAWRRGGNMGQPWYLYLTTAYEDALWFAEAKGCSAVVQVTDMSFDDLIPDPEDSTSDTVKDEIETTRRLGLPAKLALVKPLGPDHFRLAVRSR